jgi:anti-sigma factor RsiW
MSHTTLGDDHVRLLLGLYVMGKLPESERKAVEAHLSECAQCHDEFVELVEMPSLLAMLTDRDIQALDQLRMAPDAPLQNVDSATTGNGSRSPVPNRLSSARTRPPQHAKGADEPNVRRPAASRSARPRKSETGAPRRPARRLGLIAAAVALVMGVGLGINAWVQGPEQSINPELTASAVDQATGASLSVVVKPTSSGARVQATVYGLHVGQVYQLFAVAKNGQTQVVSRWSGSDGANAVSGNVTGPPNELAFFTVAVLDGTPVVTVRVTP